jgi:hypothetical protein
MKEIAEVEEKPFTSSLNICPEGCHRIGWISVDISFKDDVSAILLLSVSLMQLIIDQITNRLQS